MKIGLLNEIASLTLRHAKADGSVPPLREAGNPLAGERFLVHWQQLMEQSLYVTVDLGAEYFVGDLCLAFGERGTPRCVTVYDAQRQRVLCRHCGETGQDISQNELTLTVGEALRTLVLCFDVYFSCVDIVSLRLYGAELDGLPLFPTPVHYEKGEGTLSVTRLSTYEADSEIAGAAAALLAERLCEEAGISASPAESGAWRFVTDPTISQNGYRLCVSEDGVELRAADLRGFVYGGEGLLKLIRTGCVDCCVIDDAPRMPFRGVHLILPGTDEMAFARRLIKHVVSPMGYNAVILEIAGGMRFDSHPEITEAVLNAKARAAAGEWPAFPHASAGGMEGCVEKRDVAELADYIRSFGIDVIPEVQSLGHVQFMTLAHPEIAERDESEEEIVDELAADVPPKRFYPHCYCPSKEKSYEILFDLMDEIIETVRPTRYVHIGHDEVYQIGVCPVCREKDPAELFAADVQRIYGHLATKGLKTMMWSDMLQPVTKYRTPAAADKLPRDIVMLDFIWYFHMDKDIEDNLLSQGFLLVYGNLYSSHFPRFEGRIAKDGVIGGQSSAWVGTNENALGKEGKIYDFMYTAQMLWSATYSEHLRTVYDRKLRSLMPALRLALRGESPVTGQEILLFASDRQPPYATADIPRELPVNHCFRALILEHVTTQKLTRVPWGPLDELGCYRVAYTDGTVVEIPITYGGCIGHWARRQNEPMKGSFYRHNGYFSTYFTDGIEGKLPNGTPTTVYRFEWRNPHPEKQIASLTLCENGVHPTRVLLLRLLGIA